MRLRPTTIRSACSWLAVGALAATAGCAMFRARDVPPMAAPTAAADVRHFMGTPLSGVRSAPVEAAAVADAWHVAVAAFAVRALPADGYQRVGPLARLVVGPELGTVLAPTSKLVYATTLRSLHRDDPSDAAFKGQAAGGRVEIARLDGGVMIGSTFEFALRLPDAAPRQTAFARRGVAVQIARRQAGDGYELAIVSDDLAVAPTAAAKDPPRGVGAALPADERRELVLLDRNVVDGEGRVSLAIPMSFPGSPARGVVIDLAITAGSADDRSWLEPMRQALVDSAAARAAELAAALPSAADLDVAQALNVLGAPGYSARGTLTFLSRATAALLTESVLAVADDRVVEVIAGDVQAKLVNLASRDRRSVAWLLDRATIASIASIRDEDAAALLPPIEGALSIYAGEVGRHLDVLASLAGESSSSEDLYNRIVAEHRILLEESSPAIRLGAFDWLRGLGLAPPGYDPLGPQKARRAALERQEDQTSRPTTRP